MTDIGEEPTFWFDTVEFPGCMAASIALPDWVPLEGRSPITIHEDFLTYHGASPEFFDHEWMKVPFTALVSWHRVERSPDPMVEDALSARAILREMIGHQQGAADVDASMPSQPRSVAVCLIPVRSREAALAQTGKLDVLTVAHWILADVIRAVRMTTDLPLPDLSYRRLAPIVPVTYCDFSGDQPLWDEAEHTMFLEHLPDRMRLYETLPVVAVEHVASAFGQISTGRPATVVKDHIGRANAAASSGDQRASALDFATACEVLLDYLLASMLWEEGYSPADAANLWDSDSITKRIKTHYSPRLGGNWNPDTSPSLMQWRECVADVRNRVIHGGSFPTNADVKAAKTATEALASYATQRLVIKWKTYPRTLALLVGTASIQRYGSKSKRDAILESHRAHIWQSGVDFAQWHNQWMTSRMGT